MSEVKASRGAALSLQVMTDPCEIARSPRRHPWPRLLVRARRVWFGITEMASFLGAVLAAVARFLLGRWPEPQGRDYRAPRGRGGPRKIRAF